MGQARPSGALRLSTGNWPARVIALLGVGLLFHALIQSRMGFILAHRQPAVAVAIAPGNPMALTAQIEALTPRASANDAPVVTDLAQRAILAESYNPVALRTLGIVAAYQGQDARAAALMEMSATLSKRDTLTHAWLLDQRMRQKRYKDAVEQGDILLRQRAANWEAVIPLLVQHLDDPDMIDPMARMLATKPKWRVTYLQSLGNPQVSAGNAYPLFLRLKAIGSPPTTRETTPYFLRAWDHLPVHRLYSEWQSLLPPQASAQAREYIHDGNFNGLDAPPPFNWRIAAGDGVTAEFTRQSALFVAYPGDSHVTFAQQQLMLPPGDYHFTSRAWTDAPLHPTQIYWSIGCGRDAERQEIFKIALNPDQGQPAEFSGHFNVPPQCDAPKLSLIGAKKDLNHPARLWVGNVTVKGAE